MALLDSGSSWLRDLRRTIVLYLAVGAAILPFAIAYGILRSNPELIPRTEGIPYAIMPWLLHGRTLVVTMAAASLLVAACVWRWLAQRLERPGMLLLLTKSGAAQLTLLRPSLIAGHATTVAVATAYAALTIGDPTFHVVLGAKTDDAGTATVTRTATVPA
jgi:hypothetical protein